MARQPCKSCGKKAQQGYTIAEARKSYMRNGRKPVSSLNEDNGGVLVLYLSSHLGMHPVHSRVKPVLSDGMRLRTYGRRRGANSRERKEIIERSGKDLTMHDLGSNGLNCLNFSVFYVHEDDQKAYPTLFHKIELISPLEKLQKDSIVVDKVVEGSEEKSEALTPYDASQFRFITKAVDQSLYDGVIRTVEDIAAVDISELSKHFSDSAKMTARQKAEETQRKAKDMING